MSQYIFLKIQAIPRSKTPQLQLSLINRAYVKNLPNENISLIITHYISENSQTSIKVDMSCALIAVKFNFKTHIRAKNTFCSLGRI